MKRWMAWLAVACLAAGIVVLLYNPARGLAGHLQQEAEMSAFRQQIPQKDADVSSALVPYTSLLSDMQQYNENLFTHGQSGLVDAWSYEQPMFDLSAYGISTDVFAILEIPSMNETLPVYLGATEENLAKGVAILGQTSMPVGGTNTNCVIAGHRGYRGSAMFREIERLQIGDRLSLTTYWGEIIYEVESTAIIQPDEIDAIRLQPDKEMLTLITCHPYRQNKQRYVVYCTALADSTIQTPPAQTASSLPRETTAAVQTDDAYTSSALQIQIEQWAPLLAVPLVCFAGWNLLSLRRSSPERRRKRHK